MIELDEHPQIIYDDASDGTPVVKLESTRDCIGCGELVKVYEVFRLSDVIDDCSNDATVEKVD